ncbi:hypothetical protein SARC_11395 [Sphaeroforma arctica JP610]|uniref:Cytochrome P450 n=1 Tax=Sphaeroforma arctica JP610 TaxID=667725 RepID=A0A0L0FI17_9EUKA|nr:hypothetical protein SARC_11395 [Sphaeroforma arctica JP610]KNC76091.1 hypothetical protein SARC_11395 [Sphaeroforma arctica JP610]|eukprot:XP_014149993.1 hypothetical protein SARC_11395 [Sphaeroforma arctica JP610]
MTFFYSAALTLCGLVALQHIYQHVFATHPKKKVPGPPGRWLIGNIFDFVPDRIHEYFSDCHKQYGPFVRYKLGSMYLYAIADPSLVRNIVHEQRKNFTLSRKFQCTFGHFFPNCLICVEGDKWKLGRRVVHSAITRMRAYKWLPEVTSSMRLRVDPFLEKAAREQFAAGDAEVVEGFVDLRDMSVNIENALGFGLFEAFLRFGYGVDASVTDESTRIRLYNNTKTIAEALNVRSFQPSKLFWYLPTAFNRRVSRAHAEIMHFVRGIVSSRMAEISADIGCARDNLVDQMILASMEEKMETGDVEDNLGMLLFAAFDTTTATLSTCLQLISRHPHAQTELRNQFTAWKQGGADVESLQVDVPYLDWCIKESQRLYPVAFAFGRTSTVPVTVDGYEIPAESSFTFQTKVMGSNAKEWNFTDEVEDPMQFRPERWADESMRSRVVANYVFNPFGAGGRMCPGMKLAQSELRMVAATILTKFVLKPSEYHDMDFKVTLTLGPRDGAWFKVKAVDK